MTAIAPSAAKLRDTLEAIDIDTACLMMQGTLNSEVFHKAAPKLHQYLYGELDRYLTAYAKEGQYTPTPPNWSDWSTIELAAANITAIGILASAMTERHREVLEIIAEAIAQAIYVRVQEPRINRAKNFEAN